MCTHPCPCPLSNITFPTVDHINQPGRMVRDAASCCLSWVCGCVRFFFLCIITGLLYKYIYVYICKYIYVNIHIDICRWARWSLVYIRQKIQTRDQKIRKWVWLLAVFCANWVLQRGVGKGSRLHCWVLQCVSPLTLTLYNEMLVARWENARKLGLLFVGWCP
jgi:hypothetical protein